MSLYGLHDVISVQLGAAPRLKLYVKSSNGWVPEHSVDWEEEGEIEELIDRGLITVNGDIYGNSGTTLHNDKIIGTLTHITNWQKLV